MIVAIVFEDNTVEITEYPYIKSVEEVRPNFFEDTILIELNEKPEVKEGYELAYNGSELYYREVKVSKHQPSQLDIIMKAIADQQEQNLLIMESQASIYETFLEMGGTK